jgi:hypothetical protein
LTIASAPQDGIDATPKRAAHRPAAGCGSRDDTRAGFGPDRVLRSRLLAAEYCRNQRTSRCSALVLPSVALSSPQVPDPVKLRTQLGTPSWLAPFLSVSRQCESRVHSQPVGNHGCQAYRLAS